MYFRCFRAIYATALREKVLQLHGVYIWGQAASPQANPQNTPEVTFRRHIFQALRKPTCGRS